MKQFNFSGVVGWDVMPDDLRTFLKEAGGDDVEIIISSPGGYVGDALEMFNMIRRYDGKTTAVLSGYAMSAASYIPLAADKIVAEDNAVYMIHNARGGVIGDHNQILKYGQETQAISKLFARAYSQHTGQDIAEIEAMMDEETFIYGQDIVAAGFAHDLVETGSHDDRENYVTFATEAYRSCSAKLAENVKAAADDITRAAAMAENMGGHQKRAVTPATPNKEQTMDLEKLKNEHPDLVAALSEGIVAGLTMESLNSGNPELAEALVVTGAEAERARINDVRSQLIPGHEELVESMAFDGQSTGADAAKAIVAAEKEARAKHQQQIETSANGVVPPADPGDGDGAKEMKRDDFNALTQDERRIFLAEGGSVKD